MSDPQVLFTKLITKAKPVPKWNTSRTFLKSLPLKKQMMFATINVPMPHWTVRDNLNFMKGTLDESNFEGNWDGPPPEMIKKNFSS
jgi:hypothetical protein